MVLFVYFEIFLSYDKALEIDPKYHVVWNNKGNLFASRLKHREAIDL